MLVGTSVQPPLDAREAGRDIAAPRALGKRLGRCSALFPGSLAFATTALLAACLLLVVSQAIVNDKQRLPKSQHLEVFVVEQLLQIIDSRNLPAANSKAQVREQL